MANYERVYGSLTIYWQNFPELSTKNNILFFKNANAHLNVGMRNRSVGSHRMNDYSSRSHTILTVHITSELQAEGSVFISKQGKVNFVDLAGSEMTKKTNSEGKTLEEANNINKSLMVLGKIHCIRKFNVKWSLMRNEPLWNRTYWLALTFHWISLF